MSSEISIYIHVPFCRKKCPYCHFYSVVDEESRKERFFLALLQEIERKRALFDQKKIYSIYFGGGTPFLLGPDRCAQILDIFCSRNCEITIEANPETIAREQALLYREAGCNRLSMGVQSFLAHELLLLGREHSADQAIEAIEQVEKAGFSNISIDLMYELPRQTLTQWETSLENACSLPIQHLSMYNLVVEPKSAWYGKKDHYASLQPNEEIGHEMYRKAIEICSLHGFSQYEISAFSKPNMASRHNLGYWEGRDFLGFGPSAFSFYDKRRFSNIADLSKYCDLLEREESVEDFSEEIPSRLREMVAVGLRMNKGIDMQQLEATWGKLDDELQQTLDRLIVWEVLEREDTTIRLTDQGRFVYDEVASEII